MSFSNHQQSFKYILRQSCWLYINAIYDYLLSKVCSTANVVELIVVRARIGLGVRRFGSEKSVTRTLLGLLPLTVPKPNQSIELLPLLHLLLRGQRTRWTRFKPD